MARRETALRIDLGGEQILPERLEAVEALSTPFQVALDIIAPLGELDLLPHLGNDATISLYQDNELQRHFHGYFVEGEFLRESSEGFHYRLNLRPWTYFLAQNSQFAIYQEKTAKQILQDVFERANVSDVNWSYLTGDGAKREYCVQYGESDFAFISRLMEEEGFYYFFRHEEDRHIMVLCDKPSSHQFGKPKTLTFNPQTKTVFNVDTAARTQSASESYLQSWIERVQTGGHKTVVTRDFDFTKPERPVEATVEVADEDKKVPLPQEVYEYPGGYTDEKDGKTLNEVTLVSLRADRHTYRGQSQSSGLSCGTKMTVKEHPTSRMNGDYMITRTFHTITAERYRTGQKADEESYNVMVEAIPAKAYWRAPQVTPRPVVHGLETAIVTGPESEEIFTDEYGRVKVRFPWDRSNSKGEETTCWMRVSQTGGLGNIILPRVGHEVLVDFLGGNPDRPVVVGRVFNKSHMPIYNLPDHKTRALWRTKTYGAQKSYGKAKGLDSGQPKANEIRFEDKGGEEEIFVHAERDMNTRVRHEETHHVGLNQSYDVGNDRTTNIDNDDSLTIGNNLTIKVKNKIDITAGTSVTITVGASKITMDGGSIKLESPMIDNKANATFDASSPKTTVKGDGLLVLNGGLTKIN